MPEVRQTAAFTEWLRRLKDERARTRIVGRLRRLELGNSGDVAPVGEGVSEMRIHYGPGYRVYFFNRGQELVIVLGGGDKSTQGEDIGKSLALARKIKEQNDDGEDDPF